MYWKLTFYLFVFTPSVIGMPAKNIDGLNTAKDAGYLSPLEKEVVYEINLLRADPARYAVKFIAPLEERYQRKILYYPGDKKPIKTHEGVKALKECVRELIKTAPLPIMYPSLSLTQAANDHQMDQSATGNTGHTGTDRSDLKERIERYGVWKERIAENIAYGNTSARQIVIFLLIDDNIRNRGHRRTLLHPQLKRVGVSTGRHSRYNTMCVMDFAGQITEKSVNSVSR